MKWFKIFKNREAVLAAFSNNPIRLVKAGELEIAIGMVGHELFAVNNRCPHMNEGLSAGKLNSSDEIICPLHEYRFNIQTGQESSNRCESLAVHKIEEREDGVYLGIFTD